jgi:hypothetical protein
MTVEDSLFIGARNPRIEAALAELRGLIADHYPAAHFEETVGEDPPGIYLKVMIDIEDIDEAIPVFIERMLELQIEEGLPVYVIPLQPPARVMEQIARKTRQPIETRMAIP